MLNAFQYSFIGDDARALKYMENGFISTDWQKKKYLFFIPVSMSYLNKTTWLLSTKTIKTTLSSGSNVCR